MKKKSLLVLLFAFVLSMAMLMTACGGGSQKDSAKQDNNTGNIEEQQTEEKTTELTLEEYAKTSQEIKEAVENAAEESGMTVAFKGNELHYIYDLSEVEGYSEDLVKSEAVASLLESALMDSKQVFGNVCVELENETGIKGITTVVEYNWKGDVILSKSFTAADAE